MNTTTTSLTVPINLKNMAKEKGINMSKLFAEALAKELDTGREFERLKEKEQLYIRKLEIIRKEIKNCELLLKEKKKRKEFEQKPKQDIDKAVESILHNIKIRNGKYDPQLLLTKSEQYKIDKNKLESMLNKRCDEEGIDLIL